MTTLIKNSNIKPHGTNKRIIAVMDLGVVSVRLILRYWRRRHKKRLMQGPTKTTKSKKGLLSYWQSSSVAIDGSTQSFEECIIAANAGDVRAQRALGRYYYYGSNGAPQSDVEAFKWFKEAAMQNSASAQFRLAFMYSEGRGVEQNLVEARKWYLRATQRGHAMAKYVLGLMCMSGVGGDMDLEFAVYLFAEAAAQGLTLAQERLGDLYFEGQLTGDDPDEDEVDSGSADQKEPRLSSIEIAKMWYEKAAKRQSPHALSRLGLIYYNGMAGQANKEKARELWEAAAQQGHRHTQYLLGLFEKQELNHSNFGEGEENDG